MRTILTTRSVAIVLALTMASCGKKEPKSDTDDNAASEKKEKKPTVKLAKLPGGYDEKIEKDTLDDAANWARKKPDVVWGRKGMHIPGGGKKLFVNNNITIMTSSYEVPLEKMIAGFLVLLADDGYAVSDIKRDGAEKLSFLISAKDDKEAMGAFAVIGCVPGQSATMGNLALTFGKPDETAADAPRNLVGTPVKAHWETNRQIYSGKISKVYGKYAKIQFNDGDIGWDALEALDPKFKPDPDPTDDECAFKEGDKVNGTWSRDKVWGTVDKVYFGLAHVKFANGNPGWDECKLMTEKKK